MLSAILAFALAIPLGTATGWAASEAAVQPEEAVAATASQFNPEMIIADSLFYNGNAMTAAEIQAFLAAQIGTCTNGRCLNVAIIPYDGRGREVSSTGSGKVVCEAIPAGTYRASDLIYTAQVACGISAKVILATLQKEQSLVTSRAPSDWALNHAMGMACPDTAPCDSAFAGLGKQIVSGTRQLKAYMANHFARQPGVHRIQYSPNAACGADNLDIKNYATAALYNYTPYQPNAAAMANLYGTGDGCSSYGNRNFWRMYTDWFGSTQGEQFITTTDGVDYLIAMDGSWELWAYPTTGRGGWRPRVSLGPGWQTIEKVIGVGDLDRNGHRDVVGIDEAGVGWFYSGDGTLEYPLRRRLAVDWTSAVEVVYAGDFDGDGLADVLTTDAAGSLDLWPGKGDGTFGARKAVSTGWAGRTLLTGPGDFDGDACGDVIARLANGDLMLYAGTCAGGLRAPVRIGVGWGGMTGIYAPGDFTGDGRADLLARDASGVLLLFPGIGGGAVRAAGVIGSGWNSMRVIVGPGDAPGTLTPREPTPSPTPSPTTPAPSPTPTPTTPAPTPTPTPTPPPPTPTGSYPAGLGDLDGDGSRDFLGVTLSGGLRLYRGDGRGGVQDNAPVIAAAWGANAQTVTLGDFTGDGRPDVGRITPAGIFELFPSTGSGSLGPPTVIGPNWRGFDRVFGMDFDGDGRQDVVARDTSGTLWLYQGNGSGGWLTGNGVKIGIGWGSFTEIFAAGNFDGVGGSDVIARTSDGSLWLYPTDGAGLWRPRSLIGIGWNGFSSIFSPGDFDKSGGPDVLARYPDGRLYIYRGSGTGTWAGSRLVDAGWNTMGWIG